MADGLNIPSCPKNHLCVYHFPVGQGDSTLIVGPDRTTILIDGGTGKKSSKDGLDSSKKIIPAYLANLGIKRLDYVVITHVDGDHLGGFANSRGGKAKSLLWGVDTAPGKVGVDDDGNGFTDWIPNGGPCGQPAPDPEEINYAGSDDIYPRQAIFFNERTIDCDDSSKLRQRFYGIAIAKPGIARSITDYATLKKAFEEPIALGNDARARIVVANGWVFNNSTPVSGADSRNERSLGVYIEFDGFDYLIAGDISGQKHGNENARVEEALAGALFDISDSPKGDPLDGFKVNHHGGNNASEKNFLAIGKAENVVIPVGHNSFGHPDAEVLVRLANSPNMQTIFMTNTPSGATALPADYKGKPVEIIISDAPVIVTTDGAKIFIEAQNGAYKKEVPVDSRK